MTKRSCVANMAWQLAIPLELIPDDANNQHLNVSASINDPRRTASPEF
jgi:hypothetical protein